MAVSINEMDFFRYALIPNSIDRDRNQFDPCFAAFKRIKQIIALANNSDIFIANLELIDKASIRIDLLYIDEHVFSEMSEFYRDKEVNFVLECLQISIPIKTI